MSKDVVTWQQLKQRGLTQHKVRVALKEGTLHRIARGVYTLREPQGQLLLQALLVARPELVFTGETAAALLLGEEVHTPVQALTTFNRRAVSSELYEIKQARAVPCVDVGGIPVVIPIRAAQDLARTKPARAQRLVERYYSSHAGVAEFERHVATLSRIPRYLRTILDGAAIGADSELERRLFRALRSAGLRVSQNVLIAGYRFDGLVEGRFIVEVDCYQYHHAQIIPGDNETTATFVRDRWKSNIAHRMGYVVLRYSEMEIDFHLNEVVEQVQAIVAKMPVTEAELTPNEQKPVWTWHTGLRLQAQAAPYWVR